MSKVVELFEGVSDLTFSGVSPETVMKALKSSNPQEILCVSIDQEGGIAVHTTSSSPDTICKMSMLLTRFINENIL